jgi:hypothetical protein
MTMPKCSVLRSASIPPARLYRCGIRRDAAVSSSMLTRMARHSLFTTNSSKSRRRFGAHSKSIVTTTAIGKLSLTIEITR